MYMQSFKKRKSVGRKIIIDKLTSEIGGNSFSLFEVDLLIIFLSRKDSFFF